jgi:hypothetical protein
MARRYASYAICTAYCKWDDKQPGIDGRLSGIPGETAKKSAAGHLVPTDGLLLGGRS